MIAARKILGPPLARLAALGAGEPALTGSAAQTAAALGVALGLRVTAGQAGLILAAVSAISGAVVAYRTRPWRPGAFTAALSCVLALLAGFGVPHVTAGTVAVVSAAGSAILGSLLRGHVSPAAKPVPAPVPPPG